MCHLQEEQKNKCGSPAQQTEEASARPGDLEVAGRASEEARRWVATTLRGTEGLLRYLGLLAREQKVSTMQGGESCREAEALWAPGEGLSSSLDQSLCL